MADGATDIDPNVTVAIEANIAAHLRSFARLPGAVLHDEPSLVWVDSGVPVPTYNSVVHADFAPDAVDARIEEVLVHFRCHARPFTWHLGPSTRPTDLDRALLAHGLTLSDDEPGMAVALGVPDDGAAPLGLTIKAVRDERDLGAWVDVWLFPLPVDARRLFVDALLVLGLGDDLPWRYYLGRLDGEPVATSMLFAEHGVAGVQYVVTLPAARRLGIGIAMTRRVLDDGQALGCRLAVLTASDEGIGIYRRLGFREYCRFRRYEWESG